MQENVTLTPTSDPSIFRVDIHATGQASHLGKTALTIVGAADFENFVAGGTLVFSGANGDQISGRYSIKITPNLDGSLEVHGAFVITGGTGHFSGVTGAGRISATAMLGTPFEGHYEGTISRP
jgi:hypothetical protein